MKQKSLILATLETQNESSLTSRKSKDTIYKTDINIFCVYRNKSIFKCHIEMNFHINQL